MRTLQDWTAIPILTIIAVISLYKWHGEPTIIIDHYGAICGFIVGILCNYVFYWRSMKKDRDDAYCIIINCFSKCWQATDRFCDNTWDKYLGSFIHLGLSTEGVKKWKRIQNKAESSTVFSNSPVGWIRKVKDLQYICDRNREIINDAELRWKRSYSGVFLKGGLPCLEDRLSIDYLKSSLGSIIMECTSIIDCLEYEGTGDNNLDWHVDSINSDIINLRKWIDRYNIIHPTSKKKLMWHIDYNKPSLSMLPSKRNKEVQEIAYALWEKDKGSFELENWKLANYIHRDKTFEQYKEYVEKHVEAIKC